MYASQMECLAYITFPPVHKYETEIEMSKTNQVSKLNLCSENVINAYWIDPETDSWRTFEFDYDPFDGGDYQPKENESVVFETSKMFIPKKRYIVQVHYLKALNRVYEDYLSMDNFICELGRFEMNRSIYKTYMDDSGNCKKSVVYFLKKM